MNTDSAEPWYAYKGGAFKGNQPFFYDTEDFPWAERVESQWEVIRDEMKALIQDHADSLVPYPNSEMTSRPNKWKAFAFQFWTIEFLKNCERCPRTWEVLQSIPGATAGSFSLLEPGTTIKPHRGDTDAIVRCHLGLDVPASLPECGFRVGTETRSWENGKLLIFCDAQQHTAWNNTNENRYVLLFDVMRPEYARRTQQISTNVLAAIFLEIAYQRRAVLRRFKGRRARTILHGLFKTYFLLAIRSRMAPRLLSSER